jgi:hypothetical protein
MNTQAETSPPVGSTLLCPVCGKQTVAKAYGPFFTPDPTYRSAMTCPDEHWRGTMCATHREAEGHNSILCPPKSIDNA